MSNKKGKKYFKFLIIGILICIIILCISLIIVVMSKSNEKIDLSQKEKNISEYINGKVIPQGISRFERDYKGKVERDKLYEQLYSISKYLPDLVANLKNVTDFEEYYSENIDDIKKYIGIDNCDEFVKIANYLVEHDISTDEFNYCVYEKETMFNCNEYSTFKMKFNYKSYGDIEFEVKLLNDIQKNSSFVILLIPE